MRTRSSGSQCDARAVLLAAMLGLAMAATALVSHAATFTVTNTNDAGPGSLREAIDKSNQATSGVNTIAFNIPGAGRHTIFPLTELPAITNPVVIDGYTQPGATPNSAAGGDNAVLQIELSGLHLSSLTPAPNGLTVAAEGATVKGLVINEFPGRGILLAGKGSNAIYGNFIGTDADGLTKRGNATGVKVDPGSSRNRIGGPDPALRNVISGNKYSGIFVLSAENTTIEGNFIGTDRTGMAKLGNGNNGVVLDFAKGTAIGEASAGQRNVISGNANAGINSRNGSQLTVVGNFIGVDAAGTGALGNDRFGVLLGPEDGATIGRLGANGGNVIANNGADGVCVYEAKSIGNAIRGNRIYNNGGLGIDLAPILDTRGPTFNDDPPDDDKGPNRLQNYPVLTDVLASGAGIKVQGFLKSVPSTLFHLDFYSNEVRDPSGYGEGQHYVGTLDVTTDTKGEAIFEATLPAPTGAFISATATRAGAVPDTSEFSPMVARTGLEYGVNNTNATGLGSFAQAVLDANADDPLATKTVRFNVAGTIRPAGVTTVGNLVRIDGCTAPGASLAAPTVSLDGSGVGNAPLLNFTGNNSDLRCVGLVNHQPTGNIGAAQGTGHGLWFEGNLVGLARDGTPLPNSFGLILFGSASRVYGNVISSQRNAGVVLGPGSSGSRVQNNAIGTDASGTQNRGNGDTGVVLSSADHNVVSGNLLAYSGVRGVYISGTSRNNLISANSTFGNALGIDVAPTGPNAQNPLVLDSGTIVGSVTVAGTVSGTPEQEVRLEFFVSPGCNPSGFGEGRTYLGAAGVTTDAAGLGKFSVTLPDTVVAGQVITATVTEIGGNTSEFSRCVTIATGMPPAGTVAGVLAPEQATAVAGTTHTVTATLTSGGAPLANVAMDFAVVSGPNGGQSATVTTGTGGRATFGYASDGTPGTDAITATATVNGVQVMASAAMTWSAAGSVQVVEYFHAALDHYFITWLPTEIAILDAGVQIKGWTRTGYGFRTHTTAQAGTSPVCRIYIPPELGNSHFFGRGTAECAATVQQNPSFQVEDLQFMHMFLPAAGVCPPGTTQVYRAFSNRPDANHRYMTDKAVRAQMVAKGWLAEGDGPDMVVMCAPQ